MIPYAGPRKMTGGHPQSILVLSMCLASCWPRIYSLCPYRCLCDEDTLTVWCDGASLDVVPITLNPGLQELHLSNNRIRSIMAAFTVYQNLEYIDMAHNQLMSLAKGSFKEQTRLKVLNLNRNMISSLKNGTFTGLSSLKVLRLDENFLLDIPNLAFQPLISLETLDLSQNRISSISPLAFQDLKSLTKLLLRDNKLTQVPLSSFSQIPSLQLLDLGLNSFKAIPGNAFSPLQSLKSLSLDGCGVQMVEKGAFNNLDAISAIYLQDNDIKDLPIDALADVPHLQELHLGQNRLKTLNPEAFRGLSALRTLTVNGGKELEAIEAGAFKDNHHLERLVISHNRNLNRIEPETFRDLRNLKFVSLRGNEFTTFQEDTLQWETLESFDVRDNPLVCNCSVAWLWTILKNKNFSSSVSTANGDVSRVVCAGPPHMNGRVLIESTLDDLDCYLDAKRQILTGGVAGAGVIVALIVLLVLWHRHRVASRLEEKWRQQDERIVVSTPYQRADMDMNADYDTRYHQAAVSHVIMRPSMAKVSPITEL